MGQTKIGSRPPMGHGLTTVEEKWGKTIYPNFVQKLTTSCGNNIENFICFQMFATHICMIWYFLIIRTRWHPISLEHLFIENYSPTAGLLASSTPCLIFSKQKPDELSITHTKLVFVLLETVQWLVTCIWNKMQVPHLAFARPCLLSTHSLCPEPSRAFAEASFSPRHAIFPQVLAWLVFLGNSKLSSHVTSFLWPGPVWFSS